jgi:hypothetical protein
MPRLYTVVFSSVAVTAQQDFFEIAGPSDAITVVHDWMLTQSTEVGDAQEEGLSILVKRGATVAGSGGSTPTPSPIEFGDVAYGGVTKVNNTTKANTGTIATMGSYNWNVRVPFQFIYTPETRPVLSPSQRLTIELATTPADSITVSGTITFSEIGG